MNAIEVLLHQPWAARLGWTLVHFLWQGTLIALLFAGLRGVAGARITARSRYGLACFTLASMMAAPVLTFAALGSVASAELPAAVWRLADGWQRMLPWLVLAWLTGVVIFSVRLMAGLRWTHRLRNVAVGTVPPAWQQELEALVRRMRVTAPVRLLMSPLATTPSVIGWLRPVILLPVEALAGLPIEQVRALLAHELAHVVRHDYLVNIVQSIAEAVLFYHPAVWWVSGQIRSEREACCDDLAVAASGDLLVYATALADLDAQRRARLSTAMAANGGSLVKRIRRLLGEQQADGHDLPGAGVAWALTLLWIAGAGAATLHGAVETPARALRPFVAPSISTPAPRLLEPPRPARLAPLVSALLFDPLFAPPQAAPLPSPKKARLEGRVVTSTGEPVRNATVRMSPSARFGAGPLPEIYLETTGDDGKFAIDEVVPGRYELSSTKTGYAKSNYGFPVDVSEGAAVKDVEMKMARQAIVSGRITNEDGEAVPNAEVRVRPVNTPVRDELSRGLEAQTFGGRTNALGNFSIGEIPPGRYYLVAQPQVELPYTQVGEMDLITYYPRATERADAAALEISAATRLDGINVRLRREHLFNAKGKVVLNGSPVRNTLLLMTASNGSSRSVEVRDGVFEIVGLFPATYTLKVEPEGRVVNVLGYTLGLSGSAEFTIKDRDVEGVVLAASEGVALRGLLRLEDGKPLSGSRPQVSLMPSEGSGGGIPRPMRADGSFELPAVASGTYLLDVAGLPSGAFIQAVALGSKVVTRSPLQVAPGAGPLEIVISMKAGSVTGTLRSEKGEPRSGILVTAWPLNPDPGSASHGIRTVSTDQKGAYTIGGLEPGEYRVAAWEEIEPGLTKRLDFLGAFHGQAATVKVPQSGTVDPAVKVISKDKIAEQSALVKL